ncbi:MAG: ABC transporter permease [Nocardioidaceae bacterium]
MTTFADLETVGGDDPTAAPEAEGSKRKITGKSPTAIAFQRLRHDKMAVFSASIVLFLVILGVFCAQISAAFGVTPADGDSGTLIYLGYPAIGPPFHGFIWSHPLGINPVTASDNLAQLLYGIRTSFAISVVATVLSTAIGLVLGLVAGFARGWVDRVISFTIDAFLSFPFLLGALALAPIITTRYAAQPNALSYASFAALVFVLTFFGWMGLARLIRGQVFQLREREYIQAAQVIGVPTRRILFKELLPNLIAPLVVSISLSMPAFVAAEAGLSYLGIGITGMPSLGQTIAIAVQFAQQYPLFLWAPVLAVALLVLSLNLLGDSVRDAFDPQTRR